MAKEVTVMLISLHLEILMGDDTDQHFQGLDLAGKGVYLVYRDDPTALF